MRRWLELLIVLLLASITELLFWDGQWDLSLASRFYRPEQAASWPEQNFWLWRTLYFIGEPVSWIAGILAFSYLLASRFSPSRFAARKTAWYWLLFVILGPGLLINGIAKENWGRPRPRETVELGGVYPYQPPLKISDHGRKSFVCGHCASAFLLFGLYFPARRHRYSILFLATGYGLLMGWARMAAGGHFLSDILWSGYLMFLLAWLLYYALWPGMKISQYGSSHVD